MAKHIHAENMALYAQDALVSDTPWRYWEVRHHDKWFHLNHNPNWHATYDYRRKPERISVELECGEVVSWPKPYTGKLLLGAAYWRVGLDGVHLNTFKNDITGNLLLSNGMVYLVKEDAKEALVARQLIFTQGM